MTSPLPDEDRVTLRVVAERLADVQASQTAIQQQLTQQAVVFVPRGEWVLRNQQVDGTFSAHGREIGDLRAELRSRRLPWPSVVAAIVSCVALAVGLGIL